MVFTKLAAIDPMAILAKSTVALKTILHLLEIVTNVCHQQTKMGIMKKSAEKLCLIQLYH